jgi:uncharacterized phage protein (TIGR02218 family)
MISTTPEHIALLQTREFWAVDLYEFEFVDGSVLRLSGHALSTTWNGLTYAGGGPIFSRGETRQVRGLEADSLSIEITPRETDELFGIPIMRAVQNGALDGARVSLYRGHAAAPGGALAGAILKFRGEVQEVESDVQIRLTVKSDLIKLDAPIPRDVWQPGCSRTLYDVGCGVSRAVYQATGICGPTSTNQIVKTTSLVQSAGYYTGGEIRFISGSNAGTRRSIRSHPDSHTLRLSYPLLHAVTSGDEFQIWPGCAHTAEECLVKFNNLTAFNGQPFVPSPETML